MYQNATNPKESTLEINIQYQRHHFQCVYSIECKLTNLDSPQKIEVLVLYIIFCADVIWRHILILLESSYVLKMHAGVQTRWAKNCVNHLLVDGSICSIDRWVSKRGSLYHAGFLGQTNHPNQRSFHWYYCLGVPFSCFCHMIGSLWPLLAVNKKNDPEIRNVTHRFVGNMHHLTSHLVKS